jgi:hypothetical protein
MIEMNANATYNGKPLEVLNQLIEKRRELLEELPRDAIVATAITVLRSLRADTRIAPKKIRKSSYIVEETPYVASWERVGKTFRRVARVSGTGAKAPIYPVNLAGPHYVKGEAVKVYRVEPRHQNGMTWEKNRNKALKCWFVFAQSRKVAEDFAERHLARRLNKWRGLAKNALAFAMAKTSTRQEQEFSLESSSSRAKAAADAAANVVSQMNTGSFSMIITDAVRYAKRALKSGPSGIDRAIMKAANSTAGMISKVAASKLDAPIPTPFPEIVRSR